MSNTLSAQAEHSSLWRRKLLPAIRWFFGFKPSPIPPETPQLSVTVIVPAYNEEASIAKTIESILAQTYKAESIVVVDDHSKDRTSEIALEYAATHPSIKVVRTHVNQGSKAMAQNYVLKDVTTDLFVTIDGDTTLDPDAIERTLHYFNRPNTLIVCGFVIPQKIKTFWERARFFEYLYGLSTIKPAQEHWGSIMVASGCFSIFRTKKIMEEFGGFKKRTIVEDMDLTWEVIEAGYEVYFASDAVCRPVEPATFKVTFDQLERWYRGFFQNIMIRGNLFRHSKRIAIAAYSYMIWSFFGALVIPVTALSLTGNLWVTLMVMAVVSLVFAGLPSFYQAWKFKMLKEALLSFPAFVFIPYVNLSIYLYAAWKELILRQKLTEWKKGHAS